MSATQTVTKSIVINNVERHDTVTVSLDINVGCDCAATSVRVGSYTDVAPETADTTTWPAGQLPVGLGTDTDVYPGRWNRE